MQVEGAVAASGRRAVLISFSLGGPYTSLFLDSHVGPDWREAHVEALISLSGGRGVVGVVVVR
jgi:hypothetical protein